jgi:lambda repressor-like predicted transcriptional regulator
MIALSTVKELLQSLRYQQSESSSAMIHLKVEEVAKAKGVSMRQLAKRSGLVYNTIRLIYRNPYRPLSTITLDKLAKALEVDASVLIESVPDDEKEAQ